MKGNVGVVQTASSAHKSAAESLITAVKQTYPVGTKLLVALGGHKVEVKVTGHCNTWWTRPGVIFGENIKTGKRRDFDWSRIIEVLA